MEVTWCSETSVSIDQPAPHDITLFCSFCTAGLVSFLLVDGREEEEEELPVDFRASSTLNIRMKNGKVDE
jgi:hypothetical protein